MMKLQIKKFKVLSHAIIIIHYHMLLYAIIILLYAITMLLCYYTLSHAIY